MISLQEILAIATPKVVAALLLVLLLKIYEARLRRRSNIPSSQALLGVPIPYMMKAGSLKRFIEIQANELKLSTFRLGSTGHVFLTDPAALRVLRSPSLKGRDVIEPMVRQIFGYPAVCTPVKEKLVHDSRNFLVRPEALAQMRLSLRDAVVRGQTEMLDFGCAVQSKGFEVPNVMRFAQELVFRTIMPVFVCEDLNREDAFHAFADFSTGLQEMLSPKAKIADKLGLPIEAQRARDKFRHIMAEYGKQHGGKNFAPLLSHSYNTMMEFAKQHPEVDEEVIAGIWGLMPLSAAFLNTAPTTCWVLINLALYKDAKEALLEEFKEKMPWLFDTSANNGEVNWDKVATMNILKEMPVAQSIISESLRLCGGTLVIRQVIEDTSIEFTDSNGVEQGPYNLTKGENVYFSSNLFHMNGSVFENPESFIYDRFIDPETKTFDAKKRVLVFGDGVDMCPGRFFVKEMIILHLGLILSRFDIAPLDLSARAPTPNPADYGFGIMDPDRKDWGIRLIPRLPAHHHSLRATSSSTVHIVSNVAASA